MALSRPAVEATDRGSLVGRVSRPAVEATDGSTSPGARHRERVRTHNPTVDGWMVSATAAITTGINASGSVMSRKRPTRASWALEASYRDR